MATKRYRNSLLLWLFIAIAVSSALTRFFWCVFCENQSAKDLFGIFGIWITIIGLWIGIDQIARLRGEKEIIQTTYILAKLADIREILSEASYRLNQGQNITRALVFDHIEDLSRVQKKIFFVKSEDCEYIDCDDFINKIDDLINDLNIDANSPAALKTFRMASYNSRIGNLLQTIINAEKAINNN